MDEEENEFCMPWGTVQLNHAVAWAVRQGSSPVMFLYVCDAADEHASPISLVLSHDQLEAFGNFCIHISKRFKETLKSEDPNG
jgi:hypothetical protein